MDHPSFGMAIVGRVLEAHGFRVGIIAQPDWRSTDAFQELGPPKLFYGITAGNMDSMVNRYTSDRKIRRDDAYTPEGEPGKRPDRSAIVYAQRAREAYPAVPIVLGGIEASLRRVAHYDYWSEKVRRSVLMDSKADVLLFGNAERAICEVALDSRQVSLSPTLPMFAVQFFFATAYPRDGRKLILPTWTRRESLSRVLILTRWSPKRKTVPVATCPLRPVGRWSFGLNAMRGTRRARPQLFGCLHLSRCAMTRSSRHTRHDFCISNRIRVTLVRWSNATATKMCG